MKQFKTKKAFTLEEIIITILIIGIVAVLTIPTLLKNNKTKQLVAAQKVLMTNLRTAMGNMQADEKLMGYQTTADFVNELQKYLKITQICDSSHLSDCFPGEFTAGGETKTVDDIKTAKNLGKRYNDDNIGIITVNGISAIVTYNPACQITATNLRDSNTMSCLGMMYDLNAKAKPNNTSTDIKFLNASLSGDCIGMEINGVCWDIGGVVAGSPDPIAYCQSQGGHLPTKDELRGALVNFDDLKASIDSNLGTSSAWFMTNDSDDGTISACLEYNQNASGGCTRWGHSVFYFGAQPHYNSPHSQHAYYTMCIQD